jgi:WhiB family redox-sensing transcriptional regulator
MIPDELAPFLFVDQPWAPSAICSQVDPEVWFPDRGKCNGQAKRVCAGCPVLADCLDWALTTNQRFGVWGAMSTAERDAQRREQKVSDSPADQGVSSGRRETMDEAKTNRPARKRWTVLSTPSASIGKEAVDS